MLHYTMALDSAMPALAPLFEAYKTNLEEQFEWIVQLKLDPEIAAGRPHVDGLLERIGNDSLHALSGCIVVIGDNVLKGSAHSMFRKLVPDRRQRELMRRDFGDAVRGNPGSVTFGAALYAGANAFRHYEEWAAGAEPFPETKAILDRLGIAYDDEACTRILELLTPRKGEHVFTYLTLERFKNEIEVVAAQMWDAAYRGRDFTL
jgi:hypothetical protein